MRNELLPLNQCRKYVTAIPTGKQLQMQPNDDWPQQQQVMSPILQTKELQKVHQSSFS